MFLSAKSITATLILIIVLVGTPPISGSENWSDFFRILFSIPDYEAIIQDELNLSDRLDRKDLVVLGKLAAKTKVIDALAKKKISFPEAAACFYFIQKDNSDLVSISDKNFRLLPKQTQSSINLLRWANPSLINCQLGEFESFKLAVENAECEGSEMILPMPPLYLTAELTNLMP